MRLINLSLWVLLCGIAAFAASPASAQTGRQPGHIVAAKVTGSVIATNLTDQVAVDLKDGAIITQNYVVTTGAGSGVILLLSNGATLNVGPESTLSIDEFMQDPFADSVAAADLHEEPTTSVTRLHLARGELVGNVKKIKSDQGSSFTVNTPVGAAGIRGTTFRIVFRPTASGQAFFSLSTAEGRVLLEAPANQQQVSVPMGQEVVVTVEVEVNVQTGLVVLTAPPAAMATTDISPATQAAIASAAQQIIEATSAVIISATRQAAEENAAQEKAAADKAEAEKAADEKADQEKSPAESPKEESPTPTEPASAPPPQTLNPAPPPATTPTYNTTPGDGR